MTEMVNAHHGKQANQKLKPYLVLQYLLRETDENHLVTADNIVSYLELDCGITAERRSIYKDIEEINKANLLIEEECTIQEAEEMLKNDAAGDLKLIVYDKSKKGFYVRQRHFDLTDIRLLAECVYSTKFIAEGQAKRLLDVVCEFVSEHQAEKIRHNAFLTDRVKTNNRSVLNNIATINEAMSRKLEGQAHMPEKITFKYLKYTIDDTNKQVERRHGKKYCVSPYQLLISDGNYYLLAFSDQFQEMRTYRVDRMKEVSRSGEARDGEAAFKEIDLHTYTQRTFGMYSGDQKLVTIRFINKCMDAAVDRFGSHGAIYKKLDKNHFTVTTKVDISGQFFGWLAGFGNEVKLLEPSEVVEQFKNYIDKIREMYH